MNDNAMLPPDEQDPGEMLTEKIIELCDAESNIDVLSALMSALTYFFGRVCPACQRNVVKGIKKHLPEMVRMANELKEETVGECH
jgi:hypothetical protein